MTKPFSISLKQGERIFINGAVVRVDRKVSIEFLNDVTFLLEAHVMQPEQTTTPLRQLYFIVQTMLMDPSNASAAMQLFDAAHGDLCNVLVSPDMQAALTEVRRFVDAKRYFDALRTLRGCFPREDEILRGTRGKREKLIGAIG
jgi:flagellar biosynthesis repressor protein FlbT